MLIILKKLLCFPLKLLARLKENEFLIDEIKSREYEDRSRRSQVGNKMFSQAVG